MESTNIKYKDWSFDLEHIHTNMYRVSETRNWTWGIVSGGDVTEATSNATKLISEVFSDGKPDFFPSKGVKFIVTGIEFDRETNEDTKSDGIKFVTGSHCRNPSGTGHFTATAGTVLTFDMSGEDYGFWFADGDKQLESFYKYTDGTMREPLQGPKPWSLIWSKKIKQVK